MSTSRVVRRATVITALAAAPLALLASTALATTSPAPDDAAALARAADTVPFSRSVADSVLSDGARTASSAVDQQVAGQQRRLTAAQRAAQGSGAAGSVLGGVLTQAATPTCAITGIVWDDENQNGLKTTGEGAIAGTSVILRWDSTTVLASQTTGADGLYKFDDLQCGTYDVGFTLPSGYSWTKPLVAGGTDDSKATDPGSSFLDGVTPQFTVGPNQLGTRPSTAADAVQATYVEADIDAGMFRTGSVVPGQAPATTTPAAPTQAPGAEAAATAQQQADAAAKAAASGGLASTGTAAQNIGWTGVGLLAVGVVMVAATSTRAPRPARRPV